MIIYAETSAVLRWVLRAPDADEVFALLGKAKRVVCSRLTIAEVKRVLSRLERKEEAPADFVARARIEVAQEAAGWDVMSITDAVLWRAEEPFAVEPVRMLDAVHLATARRFAELLGHVAMLSTDDRIIANWRAWGMTMAEEVR